MRDHFLLYALSAIVLLNVVAIVLLQSRLAEQETIRLEAAAPAPRPPKQVIMPDRPDVRTLVLSDNRCPDCYDITEYLDALNETVDMRIETVLQSSLALFKSDRLPAIAFNKSFEEYPTLIEGWDQVGYTITIPDGSYAGEWYVLPTQNPPYITNGTVRGRVTVTYLTMLECTECYDPLRGREWLADSRITPYEEISIDVSSPQGKALIARYNITAVPTLLLSEDAGEYANLLPGWGVVGTIETDGTYALRDLQRLEVNYYDLRLKRVMRP